MGGGLIFGASRRGRVLAELRWPLTLLARFARNEFSLDSKTIGGGVPDAWTLTELQEHGNRLGRWRSVARLRALAAPAILCPEHTAVRQSNVLTAFGDRGDQPLASRSSSTTEVEPTRTSSSSCAASQPHSAAAADEGSVKRSQSVAAVRIDEDKPHEF
ncbi:hypothetical protein HPP92_017252 [Vanilla planifolia]|uniref:Uncharacterized protein n=1 Tax=Vanilla planifolia TaxID=51239 RepID=A0A835QE42_VANPL|nr:hypothetical protein HPP92_017252 [Vanilla planifolia]